MQSITFNQFGHDFTCRQCGSQSRAAAADVRMAMMGSYGEAVSRTYYVVCPACLQRHILESSDLPVHVRNMANARETS